MPVPLDEWSAWAERLQTACLFAKEDFRTAANAMSEETFGDLAVFYLKAERENQLEGINRWLGESGGSIPMGREEKGIRNLFELFAHVARAGPASVHNSKLEC